MVLAFDRRSTDSERPTLSCPAENLPFFRRTYRLSPLCGSINSRGISKPPWPFRSTASWAEGFALGLGTALNLSNPYLVRLRGTGAVSLGCLRRSTWNWHASENVGSYNATPPFRLNGCERP